MFRLTCRDSHACLRDASRRRLARSPRDILWYQAEEGPAFMNPLRGDEMTELRLQHVALLFSFVV